MDSEMEPHNGTNLPQGEGDYMLMSLSILLKDFERFEMSEKIADALHGLCNDLCTKLNLHNISEMQFRRLISSMAKILSLAESNTALTWACVDVISYLADASVGNIKWMGLLQRLTPVVSKLVPWACTEDKKLRLLKVLQTLTFKINIKEEETFIRNLFSALITSIRTEKESSQVQLCLSVLTNLIHQNKKALKILMQMVDLKELLEYIMHLRCNISVRMEVCKLMFILEEVMFEKPDDAEVINFVKVTFCTIMDASSSGDKSSLHSCISFFGDMVAEKKIKKEIFSNNSYVESFSKIITQLEMGLKSSDLECSMYLFKFLGILVDFEACTFIDLYPQILLQGLAWVSKHKFNAGEAINTMHLILASHSCRDLSGINSENLREVFLPLLNGHNYEFQLSLIHFLKALLEIDSLKPAFKEHLSQEMIKKFLECDQSKLDLSNYNDCEPVVEMYIQLLDFVNKVVSCCNASWMTFYSSLFREPIVVAVLAVALLNGTSDLRAIVLSLICSIGFPGESITILAKAMANRQSSFIENIERFSAKFVSQSDLNWKTNSEIQKLIASLQVLVKENKLQDISYTQMIHLFECKEEVTMAYQKSLLESLNKATEERLLLQDNLYFTKEIVSGLRKELSSIKPAFDSVQSKYETSLKTLADQEDELRKLKCKLDEQFASCQITIRSLNETAERKDRRIREQDETIKVLKTQLLEKANKYASLEQSFEEEHNRNNSLQKTIEDLKEQGKEKENTIETLSAKITGLSQEVVILGNDIKSKIKKLSQLEEEMGAKDQEIQALRRIKDTVFELTGGGKKLS